ncbi:MAG TPA: TRAP transporter small permease [Alphaproteobacteria bacterium]|nr:TRAP transporter small permease [Alphaproteobacteria bacterium]
MSQFWVIMTWARANLEEVVAGAGLVLVVGLTTYNIVNRYVLQRSGVWAPELAEMIFAWVVFLGASAAWKRNMHISIGVVVRYLGRRTRAVVGVLGDIVLIAFLAYVTYLAIKITISGHSRVSPVLRIPFSYVYAGAALSFGLMLVRRSVALARILRSGLRPEP